MLLRVAAELSLTPPLTDVTDDFVCFLFDGDLGEDLVVGIEFSATEPAKRQLRAKGLLPKAFDPLEGLEVAASSTIDAGHLAAVYALEGTLYGGAPLPGAQEPAHVGLLGELSRDPYVIAGHLPRGAVRAQVRGGRGTWHDTQAGTGAWICRLAKPLRGEVAVRYFNLADDEVPYPELDFGAGVPNENEAIDRVWEQAQRVLRGAQVPLLWPRQVQGGAPELFGWSGDIDAADAVGLAGQAAGCGSGANRRTCVSSSPST